MWRGGCAGAPAGPHPPTHLRWPSPKPSGPRASKRCEIRGLGSRLGRGGGEFPPTPARACPRPVPSQPRGGGRRWGNSTAPDGSGEPGLGVQGRGGRRRRPDGRGAAASSPVASCPCLSGAAREAGRGVFRRTRVGAGWVTPGPPRTLPLRLAPRLGGGEEEGGARGPRGSAERGQAWEASGPAASARVLGGPPGWLRGDRGGRHRGGQEALEDVHQGAAAGSECGARA